MFPTHLLCVDVEVILGKENNSFMDNVAVLKLLQRAYVYQ